MEYVYIEVPLIENDDLEIYFDKVKVTLDLDYFIEPSFDPINIKGFTLYANALCYYLEDVFEYLTGEKFLVTVEVVSRQDVFINLLCNRGVLHAKLDLHFKDFQTAFWNIGEKLWEIYVHCK